MDINEPMPATQMPVELMPLPAFSDNYIWLMHRNGRAVAVDPGQASPVLEQVQAYQLALDGILITHHHPDHVGGVAQIKSAHPDAVVYGPLGEALPLCDMALKEDDKVALAGLGITLTVLDIPGHTAGHIAYFGDLNDEHAGGARPVVFCGDTLFAAGCGRVFEGTPGQMLNSLNKLKTLPLETLVCCAHEYTLSNLRWALQVEPDNTALQVRWQQAQDLRAQGQPTLPSTIGLELETNPFLRTLQDEVAQSASIWAGRELDSSVAVFAALREWKNQA